MSEELDPEPNSLSQDSNDETAASLAEHSEEVVHILEKLEPEEKELISTMISYSGPLPPPEYLRGYAEVMEDAPKRIFGWVEDQQAHRHSMEKEHLSNSFRIHNRGMLFGLIITMLFMAMGFTLIIMDKEVIGITLMAPFIITLATLIITRTRGNEREKENLPDDSEKNNTERLD